MVHCKDCKTKGCMTTEYPRMVQKSLSEGIRLIPSIADVCEGP